MDINLIKYLLEHRRPEIARKSLINCHVKGVDSIVFDDTPGRVTRMFVANENHELWKNGPPYGSKEMSISIHPHHCDLRFECIQGSFTNILCQHRIEGIPFKEFIYQSKITSDKCSLTETGKKIHLSPEFIGIWRGDKFQMEANKLHTIWIQKKEEAVWMVYEGKEDPNYKPYCYSNADLENFDSSELYQPMTLTYLYKILRKVWPEI